MIETFSRIYVYLENRPLLATAVSFLVLILVLYLSRFIVKKILFRMVAVFSPRMPNLARELLHDEELFKRLATIVPILVFHQGVVFIPHLSEPFIVICQKLAVLLGIFVGIRVITLLFAKSNEIYVRYPIARSRPIKGYLQVLTILLYIIGMIVGIATLLNKSPFVFISGLGALTAIILLVFRDTILSLVAGVQLTTNNLIRVGDWIEMPQFGADGDVIDIALNVVSVQNWDKTITVIPTHKFLENSFKNWRGMQETGGRRIKRSINIDVNTIRFLSDEEIEYFSKIVLLKDYLKEKRQELTEHNQKLSDERPLAANTRRLTNVGTFRIYITNYLRQNPKIHKNLTFLVRQLQPTADGLPIEIYVFSADTAWAVYEGVQSDIFDHVLAIAPEFGLSVYQRPSGNDLRLAGVTSNDAVKAALT